MEWCFEAATGGARGAVADDVAGFLARRLPQAAAQESGARVRQALESLTADSGRYRVSLTWQDDAARLGIRALARAEGELPGLALAPGAAACPWHADELDAGGGAEITWSELGMRRRPEESLDADPGPLEIPGDRDGFLQSVAVLNSSLIGPTPAARCAVIGAAAGRRAEEEFRRRRRREGRLNAGEVAEAFVDFQKGIGGDFVVEEATDHRAVVANRTCPLGAAVVGNVHLCRLTSAMLGSLAAQTSGPAAVTLDEQIALGDHRCRLTLQLGEDEPTPAAHRYASPPAGLPDGLAADHHEEGHRIVLSLQLPRDRLSVPLIRHLARYALSEVGVTTDVIFDIELALAEACSNVLDHAGPGDAYEVAISVRTDRCELRITDTGRGFDHVTIRDARAGFDAERGRGLSLMQTVMDRVDFVSEPERGTLVMLSKRLEFDEHSAARVLLAQVRREQAGQGRG